MYVTPAQLADRPGAQELAEVATPTRDPVVAADLMDATLRTADRSTWAAADVAIADAALANVQSAIDDAASLIDGYLAQRYPLPLIVVPTLVGVWARAITRYLLHKDRRSLENDDPIVRDYKDALKLLGTVASGKLSLGVGDPAPGGGAPDFDAPGRVFTDSTLSDFTNAGRGAS